MIRLLYISTSRLAPDSQEKQLREILDASKRNNADLGITGMLVHGGGMFLQVLEGPDNNVLRIYSKILDDPRHTDSQIVLISVAEERAFPKWAMATLELSGFEFQQIRDMLDARKETIKSGLFFDLVRIFTTKTNMR
jgi:hypothetical protein